MSLRHKNIIRLLENQQPTITEVLAIVLELSFITIDLENKMSTANSQAVTLTTDIASLKKANADQDAVIGTAVATVQSLSSANATLTQQVADLKAAVANGTDLTQAIADIESTTADINSHTATLTNTLPAPAPADSTPPADTLTPGTGTDTTVANGGTDAPVTQLAQ